MPSVAPECEGCNEYIYKMDRLLRRTYGPQDKNGKIRAWGWVCPKCGAIRIDEVEPGKDNWVYKGKYN